MKDSINNASPPLTAGARENIDAITGLEQNFLRQGSPVDRISDAITRCVGRIPFLIAHGLGYGTWLLVNAGAVPGVVPFDPYPFCFLNLLVALEAIFLSTVVLMSQNRQSRHADQRARLDLQVNLLAEQEATKMLQMLQTICHHLGLDMVARDKELKEMVEKTPVASLVQEIEKARAA